MKKKQNKSNNKPLTLDELASYNQGVLIPALESRFFTKDEIEKRFVTKDEFNEFKDETLLNHDTIFKKLDILIQEKQVRAFQRKKDKKLFLLFIKVLKEHRPLTNGELEQIVGLEVF